MEASWQEQSERLTGTVLVEITGGQGEITTNCEADCHYRNGSFYVFFEESIAEDGRKGQLAFSSRLKISENKVTLKRTLVGSDARGKGHAMEMIYEKRNAGERGCLIDYPTPYGILRLEIQTRELTVTMSRERLLVEIRYLLLQEGREASQDALTIRISKKKKAALD